MCGSHHEAKHQDVRTARWVAHQQLLFHRSLTVNNVTTERQGARDLCTLLLRSRLFINSPELMHLPSLVSIDA
jgi:hypothetical protein